MYFAVGILLMGFIDPFLWFKSMSLLGLKGNKRQCLFSFLICYMLVVGRGYIATYVSNGAASTVFTIALGSYFLITTIVLFKGNVREKVLHTCIFFCIMFAAELIIVGICLICRFCSWDAIMSNGIVNLVCSGVVKVLQAILCYCMFRQRKGKKFFSCNKESISLTLVLGILIVNAIFRSTSYQYNQSIMLLVGTCVILFLWYIIGSLFTWKQKEKNITYLEKEIKNSLEQKELVQDMEHFKYNFGTNMFVLKNLCHYKEYEVFGGYADTVFEVVERAEVLFDHPNIMIRILMSGLIQTAKKMRIPFHARIQVREFGMTDEEICSILKNLVMNGLEAAAKTPPNIAHVSLQVLNTQVGYEIRCINDCLGNVDFEKTTKQDKKNHGYGGSIVNDIVKKYHGSINRTCTREKENLGTVVVYIRFYSKLKRKQNFLTRGKRVNLRLT